MSWLDLSWLQDLERRAPPALRWGLFLVPVAGLLAQLLYLHWPLDLTFHTCDPHEVVPAARAYGSWIGGSLDLGHLAGREFVDTPPPLFSALQLLYYVVFGSYRGVALLNAVPALLISLAVFHICVRRHGFALGLVAVVLTWSFPAMIGLVGSQLGVQLLLSAMLTLALAALLDSDGFRRRRPALLAGLWTGLAALTKTSFLLFLAVPIGVELVRAARRSRRARRLGNAALAAALAVVLSAPWYVVYLSRVASYIGAETVEDPLAKQADGALARLTSLGGRLLADAGPVPLVLLGLLLAALALTARRRGVEGPRVGADVFVLLAPLGSVLLASLLLRSATSCSMYIEFAAAAPALAVAICALIHALPHTGLKIAAAALVVVVAGVQHARFLPRNAASIAQVRASVTATRNVAARIRRPPWRSRRPLVAVWNAASAAHGQGCPAASWTYLLFFAGWNDTPLQALFLRTLPGEPDLPPDTPGDELVTGSRRHSLRPLIGEPGYEPSKVDYVLLWHARPRPLQASHRHVEPDGRVRVRTGQTVFQARLGHRTCQLLQLPR